MVLRRCHCGLVAKYEDDGHRYCGNHAPSLTVQRHHKRRITLAISLLTANGYAVSAGVSRPPAQPTAGEKEDERADAERWRAVNASPWSLRDVMLKLAEAADHLHSGHDCDMDGHEEVRTCAQRAREIVALLGGSRPPAQEPPPESLEGWTLWASNPPPPDTVVEGKWTEDGTPMFVTICKKGCCVADAYEMSLHVPKWWRGVPSGPTGDNS